MFCRRFVFAVLCILTAVAAHAAEQKENPTYDDPLSAAADPDFAIQGEYVGELDTGLGALKTGARVIALGKGKFRTVLYLGGLPGDGWNKEIYEGDGELKNGVAAVRAAARNRTHRKRHADDDLAARATWWASSARTERKSTTLGRKPPEDAVVLFDGKNADAFENSRFSDDGLLIPAATSKQKFGSCTLHLEFRTPFMPEARGQGRGNSGCYLQGRYEVQILDSFGLAGKRQRVRRHLFRQRSRRQPMLSAAGLADLRYRLHGGRIRRLGQEAKERPHYGAAQRRGRFTTTSSCRTQPPRRRWPKARRKARSTCKTTAIPSASGTSGWWRSRQTRRHGDKGTGRQGDVGRSRWPNPWIPMMPIPFICPHCGHQTDVAEEYAGQSGPCIACSKRVTMPLPGQPGYGVESPAALPRGKRASGLVGGALALLAVGLCFCCGGGLFLAIFWPSIQVRPRGGRAQSMRGEFATHRRGHAELLR